MSKRAISVTLEEDNLLWLKGRAGAIGARSVSELLDRLVSEARKRGATVTSRSVVGTVTIPESDPLLERADEAVRALFVASLSRPLQVSEARASYGRRPRRKRRRG